MGLFHPKPKTRDRRGSGYLSEDVIIQRLAVHYTVLIPHGEPQRYDLVIEDADGRFWRVQCKTAWIHDDGKALVYNMFNVGSYTHQVKLYTQEHVAYFAVYSPDTGKVYLVPNDNPGQKRGYLRFGAYINAAKARRDGKLAEDYEI